MALARRLVLLAVLLVLAAPAAGAGGISGTWRIYSARLYYDNGSSTLMPANTRQLVISSGHWTFGSSSGALRVSPITAADWRRWGVEPYGPKRKAVLSGWSGSRADGPIEESTRVDFIWVIYRARPPVVHAPGTVWLKFGRLRL